MAIFPAQISNFISGVWTGSVTVLRTVTNVYLRATDLAGHTGTGNTFTVNPTNHLPTLAPISDRSIVQGGTLFVTNTASDIDPGQTSQITATGQSAKGDLKYSYTATAGTVEGNGPNATFSSQGAQPGTATVTCTVTDDRGKTATAQASVNVRAPKAPEPGVPCCHR